MVRSLKDQAAIVGIGATEFSTNSGRSELRLAAEAISMALEDAGIDRSELDGLVTYTLDHNPESEVARMMGAKDLKFFSRVHYGGGAACALVQQAAMAVTTGVAEVVVIYRAMNERSGYRFGAGYMPEGLSESADLSQYGWYVPFGLATPASWIAMGARRYMHNTGTTTEDFGRVSVQVRAYAATNPKARFYQRPITLEDHQNSRWIAEPLRLLDCCMETDGAQALVVVNAERAKKLKQRPAMIRAAAQGSTDDQQNMFSYYRGDIGSISETRLVARELYRQSGLSEKDIQAAILYDHFTPYVLPQLEAFGFAKEGQAKDFVRAGGIALDGRLPVNTNGGQIGEAYIHGVNGIAEAVRQLRGTAVNQARGVQHVVVTAGPGVPTSGIILGQP